jgi:glyoxylase-like metal-dependent hydrolase (beta-lactamase superfamily II)
LEIEKMAHLMRKSNGLSRRSLLKGMGAAAALAVGGGFGLAPRRAAAQDTLGSPSAFYRFMFGDLEMTIIQDGAIQFPPTNFGANALEADLIGALEANNYPTGPQMVTIDVTLVRNGDTLALFDSGIGNSFGVPARLLPTLAAVGVAPEDITNVIITHFHSDHLAGIVNENGLTFPNAAVHFPQLEYEFLQSAAGNENVDGALAQLQPAVDADQLELYASDQEVLPGIVGIAAPGHSPGHHALLVTAGGQSYLNIADTAVHPLISLYNPSWHFVFDADGAQAAETRRAILQWAVDEDLLLFGYHFPFPGIGVIDTAGDGYHFFPVGV